jgi:hypothetical protein
MGIDPYCIHSVNPDIDYRKEIAWVNENKITLNQKGNWAEIYNRLKDLSEAYFLNFSIPEAEK